EGVVTEAPSWAAVAEASAPSRSAPYATPVVARIALPHRSESVPIPPSSCCLASCDDEKQRCSGERHTISAGQSPSSSHAKRPSGTRASQEARETSRSQGAIHRIAVKHSRPG